MPTTIQRPTLGPQNCSRKSTVNLSDPVQRDVLDALVSLVLERLGRNPAIAAKPSSLPAASDPRVLVTVNEASKLLSISTAQAYKLIRKGIIPSVRLGPKCLRVVRQALDERMRLVAVAALEHHESGEVVPKRHAGQQERQSED